MRQTCSTGSRKSTAGSATSRTASSAAVTRKARPRSIVRRCPQRWAATSCWSRDPKINRIVAIKAIDLASEVEPNELDDARKNFLREAEIAGQLSHPNIVTIFDVGETEGIAYIAMEYLKGRHLSEFGAPDRLLPPAVVLELLSRTADALDYAHAQNIVHRDIKPANIMYDSVSDGLKITDFGIARLIDVGRTRTGIVLGTPAFMSPEQLEGKNVNGHTDLFALGVSLYQLLTGQLPFRGASMTKLMFVIANEPHQSVTAVRADLPEHLNAIVDRALAKDPAERFQSGAEMAAALRSAAQAA
jgi:serine/threonine protein kinase